MSVGEIVQRDKRSFVESERVDYVTSYRPSETTHPDFYGTFLRNKDPLYSNNERNRTSWQLAVSSTDSSEWGGKQVGVTLRTIEHSPTKELFSALVDAGVDARNYLFDRITRSSTPEAVYSVGFGEYQASGEERGLLLTASLLEDFGKKAWPVLKELATSKRPECELFVGLIARCEGVPSAARAGALRELAAHPDPAVRLAILDNVKDLSLEHRQSVLESLTDDSDDDVREEARQRLFETQ
jgi:hypothetical protein